MAGDLKSFFGPAIVKGIAEDLAGAYPPFDVQGFVSECLDGLDQLELLARAWQIAEAMHRQLPGDFAAAAGVLTRSLGPELSMAAPAGMEVFRYLPHVFYVSRYGVDSFEESMQAQYEITKRFTAEFSIRVFLMKYPAKTLARLKAWSADSNVHVRRLVSEGTRPRLPWAPRLRSFQENPGPVLELLELLRDDPELYVRRSVANSLNDIAKDHPDIAVTTCRRWLRGASRERQWLVRHALRSLVKDGHPGALALLGAGAAPKIVVGKPRFQPKRIRVGGRLVLSFEIASKGTREQTLVVDFAVHFVKANGSTSPKVFKLKRLVLAAGGRAVLSSTVSFGNLTTRKHYAGKHRVEARINGRSFALGTVEVLHKPAG